MTQTRPQIPSKLLDYFISTDSFSLANIAEKTSSDDVESYSLLINLIYTVYLEEKSNGVTLKDIANAVKKTKRIDVIKENLGICVYILKKQQRLHLVKNGTILNFFDDLHDNILTDTEKNQKQQEIAKLETLIVNFQSTLSTKESLLVDLALTQLQNETINALYSAIKMASSKTLISDRQLTLITNLVESTFDCVVNPNLIDLKKCDKIFGELEPLLKEDLEKAYQDFKRAMDVSAKLIIKEDLDGAEKFLLFLSRNRNIDRDIITNKAALPNKPNTNNIEEYIDYIIKLAEIVGKELQNSYDSIDTIVFKNPHYNFSTQKSHKSFNKLFVNNPMRKKDTIMFVPTDEFMDYRGKSDLTTKTSETEDSNVRTVVIKQSITEKYEAEVSTGVTELQDSLSKLEKATTLVATDSFIHIKLKVNAKPFLNVRTDEVKNVDAIILIKAMVDELILFIENPNESSYEAYKNKLNDYKEKYNQDESFEYLQELEKDWKEYNDNLSIVKNNLLKKFPQDNQQLFATFTSTYEKRLLEGEQSQEIAQDLIKIIDDSDNIEDCSFRLNRENKVLKAKNDLLESVRKKFTLQNEDEFLAVLTSFTNHLKKYSKDDVVFTKLMCAIDDFIEKLIYSPTVDYKFFLGVFKLLTKSLIDLAEVKNLSHISNNHLIGAIQAKHLKDAFIERLRIKYSSSPNFSQLLKEFSKAYDTRFLAEENLLTCDLNTILTDKDMTVEEARYQLALLELRREANKEAPENAVVTAALKDIAKNLHSELSKELPKNHKEEDLSKLTRMVNATTGYLSVQSPEKYPEKYKEFENALKALESTPIAKTPWYKTKIATLFGGILLIAGGLAIVGLAMSGVSVTGGVSLLGCKVGWDLIMGGSMMVAGILTVTATYSKFKNTLFKELDKFNEKAAPESLKNPTSSK